MRPLRGAGLVPAPRRADQGCVGDPQDFAAVYDRWMPQLTRYCRSLTRSEADAEDAAQNAMVKAMAALRRGPAPDQLQPWLHRIAHNEAISLMRRRGTAGAAVPTDVLPDVGGPSLEEVAAVRGRLQEMLGDLRALAPRQREALMLRELEGRSYREIAGALGVTEAAAQQTVFAARRSLQDCDAGRALDCEPVQRWLSAHEHALVRTRRVRAHLRDCDGCRGFQAALETRPRDLRLLLPGGTGASLVARLLGLLGGGSGVAAKVVVGAGLAATAAAGVLAIAPAPTRPAVPRTVVAASARAVTAASAAGATVRAPATSRTARVVSQAPAPSRRRLAVKVPVRSAHGTGHAPVVAPAAARPGASAPAGESTSSAAAVSSASAQAPERPPGPAAGPSSASTSSAPTPAPEPAPAPTPAVSVPATPVTPAVALPLPDPEPVVQAAASAVQQAVGAVTSTATTATAPVTGAVDHLLHP